MRRLFHKGGTPRPTRQVCVQEHPPLPTQKAGRSGSGMPGRRPGRRPRHRQRGRGMVVGPPSCVAGGGSVSPRRWWWCVVCGTGNQVGCVAGRRPSPMGRGACKPPPGLGPGRQKHRWPGGRQCGRWQRLVGKRAARPSKSNSVYNNGPMIWACWVSYIIQRVRCGGHNTRSMRSVVMETR